MEKKERMKGILKFICSFLFIMLLVYFLEWWGVLGVILFILGIVAMRCWSQMDFLKHMMRQVEVTIFGRPLDKDLWAKDEMKNTKVKIVWGSGSNVDWSKYILILVYPGLILLFIGVIWEVTSVTIISVVLFGLVLGVKTYYWIRGVGKN